MANFLDDILDYLADNGIGTVQTDLFVGRVPPDPDNCVVVLGQLGTTPAPSLDIADLLFPNWQVIIRNSDYDAGAQKMEAVRALCHVKIGLQLTNYYVLRMHCRQEGGAIGVDNKNRHEFSINFYAEARLDDGNP